MNPKQFTVCITDGNGNVRWICIITDTIQNALSLAKSLCTSRETVMSVDQGTNPVVVDLQAIKGDSNG